VALETLTEQKISGVVVLKVSLGSMGSPVSRSTDLHIVALLREALPLEVGKPTSPVQPAIGNASTATRVDRAIAMVKNLFLFISPAPRFVRFFLKLPDGIEAQSRCGVNRMLTALVFSY